MPADRTPYDRIGRTYAGSRAEDPRLAAAIRAALGDARSAVNVGAGSGNYEPGDLRIVAVEPSVEMIRQRAPNRAPAIQPHAEALPLPDASVDAALAVLSDHHWADRRRGLTELRRVARKRVVLVNADPSTANDYWLTRDYLPKVLSLIPKRYRGGGHWLSELETLLGLLEVRPLLIPHDCTDGFYQAYWRRPAAYLSEALRRNISVFHRLNPRDVTDAMSRLSADLDDGTWKQRHAEILDLDSADVGMRIVIAHVVH